MSNQCFSFNVKTLERCQRPNGHNEMHVDHRGVQWWEYPVTPQKVVAGVDPEALRELTERWREQALDGHYHSFIRTTLLNCADDLAALLPPASQETETW